MKRFCQSILLLFAILFGAAEASAQQTLTFVIRNETTSGIDYKLWSQNRNQVWPGARTAYGLNFKGDQRANKLACVRGETICYGAWFRNNPKIFWGAGPTGKGRCTTCCYVCNGSTTGAKILTYSPKQRAFGR